jgi:O-antigen/teichoic acid export membrane protein
MSDNASLRLRGGGLSPRLRMSFWGLADQTLISVANFATLLILARALDSSEFGAFVLAYTALLFLNGIQAALVTQPHNVLGQSREEGDYVRYTSSTALGQVVFSAILSVVALVSALAAAKFASHAAAILLALAPAIAASQLQEFVRRVLYTEGRLVTAYAVDLVSYGGQVGVLLGLVSFADVDAPRALYAAGATSAVGAAFGAWKIRHSLGRRADRAALQENWIFGKWLAAAIAASWLAGQLYIYLVAAMRGATAAGVLRAAQIVLGPLSTFLLFLFTILPIRYAQTRRRAGDAGLHHALIRTYVATAPLVLIYCLAVAIFSGPLLRLLYGTSYSKYGDVVVLFSVYYFVLHPVYLLTAALTAKRWTRPLFTGNLYAAALGVVAGWPLILAWGVNGAVVGMIAGALLLVVVFWHAYRLSPLLDKGAAQPEVTAVPPG